MTCVHYLRQLRPALLITVVFTLICGIAYPLLSTAIGQVAFHDKANGSLIKRDGVVVGSKLIGQTFAAPQYFHSRPSAAGAGYDGSASSGSNLGPLNPDLLSAVQERVVAYRKENGLAHRCTRSRRRGHRLGLRARSRTSRSPTPGCRSPGSHANAGSTCRSSKTSSRSTPMVGS